MRRSRPARTVMEVCAARAGLVKGARVCAFIAQWAIASDAIGREITLQEYADWWRESRATSFRDQARFREVFPELATPQPIANGAIARREQWMADGVRGLGSLPLDVVLAA